MPFIISPDSSRPRILIINPNATVSFSEAMHDSLPTPYPIDFYTAPTTTAPLSIEGSFDSVVSAAACLAELKPQLDRWDGFIVACFSAHPLNHALRELTDSPVVSIMDAPLLLASNIGSKVGVLTTSHRWGPLLTHDINSVHLSSICTAGVVSSGLSVLDLEHLPREEVLSRLGKIAREELVGKREADVIVLGCAGMVGLDVAVKEAAGKGVVVLDPVRCALEVCASLVRLGVKTAKRGMYAPAK